MSASEKNNQPEVVGQEVSRSKGTLPLFETLKLDDTVKRYSRSYYAGAFRKFLLFLKIKSTSSPTNMRVIVQFLNPVDGQWYDYPQGLFASLYYEATDTASEILECFSCDCLAREVRIAVVGVGTDSTNYFTIAPCIEFMN